MTETGDQTQSPPGSLHLTTSARHTVAPVRVVNMFLHLTASLRAPRTHIPSFCCM